MHCKLAIGDILNKLAVGIMAKLTLWIHRVSVFRIRGGYLFEGVETVVAPFLLVLAASGLINHIFLRRSVEQYSKNAGHGAHLFPETKPQVMHASTAQ